MRKALLLAMALMLLGCTSNNKATSSNPWLAPYDQWYFNFNYPHALPARVTYVRLVDTDGILYQFRTLDGTKSSPSSVGRWDDGTGAWGGGLPSFNKAKNPPQAMLFCWDSIIDKKVYETTIFFNREVWTMMLTPYGEFRGQPAYHNRMVIGLAPEGKVRVWLRNPRNPNISLEEHILVKTVSGDELDMCKGITRFPNGYEYSDTTKEFVKGKKYPYGSW